MSSPAGLMLDHPGWRIDADGVACRAVRCGTSSWVLVLGADGRRKVLEADAAEPAEATGARPIFDVVDPRVLRGRRRLTRRLHAAGPVTRLRNPDLWDATATGIVRQVIRASQARRLYQTFCDRFGRRVISTAGAATLFPDPQTVLSLSDDDFADAGMAFKRQPLRAAAQMFLEHRDWVTLPPVRLVERLQAIPRIGPWTAGAAVADATNDYSLYPFADLAVRTWAQALDPDADWPGTEPEFAQAWRELAGEHLSEWTLLTLAYGVRHAHGAAI